MEQTLKIIGAIVAILTGCITIYLFVINQGPKPEPDPVPPIVNGHQPEESLLEKAIGNYELISWTENTDLGETIYIEAKQGNLTISNNGEVEWDLTIQQRGESGPANSRIQCKAELVIGDNTIKGIPGGTAINWDSNIESVRDDVWLSFCGWHTGSPSLPYSVSIMDGILEMENTKGRFKWRKL